MCVYNKTKKNLPSIPTWSLYLGNSIDNLNKPVATRQFIFYLKDKRNLYLKRIIFRHRDEFRNYVQDTWSRRQKNDPSVSHDAALKVWDDTKMSRTLVKVLFAQSQSKSYLLIVKFRSELEFGLSHQKFINVWISLYHVFLSDSSLAKLPGQVGGGALYDAAWETLQHQDGGEEHSPAQVPGLPPVVIRLT